MNLNSGFCVFFFIPSYLCRRQGHVTLFFKHVSLNYESGHHLPDSFSSFLLNVEACMSGGPPVFLANHYQ
jgi:hypothetical protein